MQFTFEAIGTHWEIDIYEDLSASKADRLKSVILDRIDKFDRTYSRFRADSIITQLARVGGRAELPGDAASLMALYAQMYQATQGRMTPLIGTALSQAGYDATYSLTPGRIEPVPAWEDVLEYHPPHIALAQPLTLDFGAAGKGYLVDIIAELIEATGIERYCVDASGDMRHRNSGQTSLNVGLEDPFHAGRVIGVATLANASLCASAINRRQWAGFHHVLDPATLASPTEYAAMWVFADSTALADALTTALNFTPIDELRAQFSFEAVTLNTNGRTAVTAGAPVELFG